MHDIFLCFTTLSVGEYSNRRRGLGKAMITTIKSYKDISFLVQMECFENLMLDGIVPNPHSFSVAWLNHDTA